MVCEGTSCAHSACVISPPCWSTCLAAITCTALGPRSPLRCLEENCTKVEQIVEGTEEDWAALVPQMVYDKRSHGNRGRCLAATPTSHPQLQIGDRLEPSPECQDVGLCSTSASPTQMVFWRCNLPAEPVRHRNPLWSSRLGITPDLICVDTMHTLCLGIYAQFVSSVVWWVLEVNPFRVPTLLTQEERYQQTFMLMGQKLTQFYKSTGKQWSRVEEFKVEIFGSKQAPACHLKAHQTLGVLFFMKTFLATTFPPGAHADVRPWQECCNSLVDLWVRLEQAPAILRDQDHEDCGRVCLFFSNVGFDSVCVCVRSVLSVWVFVEQKQLTLGI